MSVSYPNPNPNPNPNQVVEVGESYGECTALACSSCGRYVGMGSRGGGIVVRYLVITPYLAAAVT